jgi:aspartyl/glutamyl-tRNA(Asn/Gln) amidotransferase C subunit
MISPEEVKNLAALARLDLSAAEVEKLPHDLDAILAYVGELKGVPGTMSDEPILGDNYNRMRSDENPDTELSDLLGKDYLKVKKIL